MPIFVPGLRKQHHRPGGFRDTKRQRIMEQVTKFGMVYWSNVALRETLRAANAKDYILRRKVDRRFKEIANELVMGRGYVIATAFELEQKYPDLFNAGGVDSKKNDLGYFVFKISRGKQNVLCTGSLNRLCVVV